MNDLIPQLRQDSRFLSRLPLLLFLLGCGLSLFDLSMQSARGIGLGLIFYHLIGGALFLLVLGIPFAYQAHTTGNGKALLSATLLWIVVGMVNFATVLTNWPLKLSLGAYGDDLIRMQQGLKPGEAWKRPGNPGFFLVKEVRKLENGNAWFISGESATGSSGLVYVPAGQPLGINTWSSVPITDKWHMVEED
jgi:hypothetical protein